MNEVDNEKKVLEHTDFDEQVKILEEERMINAKKRNFLILCSVLLFFVAVIVIVTYSTIYVYRQYGPVGNNACENVNIKIDGSIIPNINITEGNECKPKYNVDYFNNRRSTFNIDLFGDKSRIFNKINQVDNDGKCILNCDEDNDGWPDYNIDLNGDGKADINIVIDFTKSPKCDLNCDINFDTIPDTNIDINGDDKPDVNVTEDNYIFPKYNIDYKSKEKPVFNILKDGLIINPINVMENDVCIKNCDIDNDGWPDYNIYLEEDSTVILNELISTDENVTITIQKYKGLDWKCFLYPDLDQCSKTDIIFKNIYINIDVNGDGVPDVNISNDGGQTIVNPLNKEIDGVIINYDVDGDGYPDYNIDIDGDGNPDLNIIDKNMLCVKNCDTNNDGVPDYLVKYRDEDFGYTIREINIDIDYDGACDVNCDTSEDGKADINIDIDGDYLPDINIDFDHDGVPEFNLDVNDDGKPENNIDVYGIGICNFNCEDEYENIINPVNSGEFCTINCDTNNDGYPEYNVDINNDGVCDFNCNNGTTNLDEDNNFHLDSEYPNEVTMLDIDEAENKNFYIMNPLSIKSNDIEPGWSSKYILKIQNKSNYVVSYKILWTDVSNNFTDLNNLDYYLTRSKTAYLAEQKAPRYSNTLVDEILIRPKTSLEYVLNLSFKDTGVLQNEDSGKAFYGKFRIEVNK